MSTELLRRQFDRNKEKLEQARAKEQATKKRWGFALRSGAVSLGLFMFGAGVEAGTKFIRDSLPSQLKDGLCYMSDVLRSNRHPHQYTIVMLPLLNDTDDRRREEIVSSFNDTAYEINVIH